MSAYLVSEKHIATMVVNIRNAIGQRAFEFAARYRLGINNTGDELVEVVANALWQENNRSVNFRYGGRNKAPKVSAEMIERVEPVGIRQLTALMDCWEYQSCETKNWLTTKSMVFIGYVRAELLKNMVNKYLYDEPSDWSI